MFLLRSSDVLSRSSNQPLKKPFYNKSLRVLAASVTLAKHALSVLNLERDKPFSPTSTVVLLPHWQPMVVKSQKNSRPFLIDLLESTP
jgi:hypothetical protein